MAGLVEFRVGAYVYHARPMNIWAQYQVLSKLGPLLSIGFLEGVALFLKLKRDGLQFQDADLEDAAKLARPIAMELASMPPEHQRYIIENCLAVCDRKGDGDQVFSPIWNSQAGVSMYRDINEDAAIPLQITLGVIDGQFRRFFPAVVLPILDQLKQLASNRST
jgi:hypothetical protein